MRLGAIAGNVVDAARETYVSIVVTRTGGANVNDPVSLAGVTLPFEWSRAVAVEDQVSGETTYEPRPKEEFIFACWHFVYKRSDMSAAKTQTTESAQF